MHMHIHVDMRLRICALRYASQCVTAYRCGDALVCALRKHNSVGVNFLQQQKSRNSENPKAHRGGNISSGNLGNLPDKAKLHRIT